MKKHVLIADRFASDSLIYLQSQQNLTIEVAPDPLQLPSESLKRANALIIRSRTSINEKILQASPQLQVVITCTSGFDHIDLEKTEKWGITVMHTPTANIESAAQLTLGHMINLAHQIPKGQQQVKDGLWKRDHIVGTELCGRTLGIVGLGRIGSRVAEIAKALKMELIVFDPYQKDEVFESLGIARSSYEEVLKTADILTFHVPKTPETKYMLNRSHFEFIHRGVIIINTSRGSVIHEQDLIQALKMGWIRAVGLDVFEKEPLSTQSPLLTFEQVVGTPHIGANTDEAFYKASQLAATKLVRFFGDGSTSDTLPPKAEWYGAATFAKD